MKRFILALLVFSGLAVTANAAPCTPVFNYFTGKMECGGGNSSGGGDASTNTSTSVDGEAVLFSGTGGKTLKRSTLTGVIKQTSGVPAAAVACTDYSAPGCTETVSGNKTYTGAIDSSGATSTAPFKSGTVLPATCAPPQLFFETDAGGGLNIWTCASTNVWTQVRVNIQKDGVDQAGQRTLNFIGAGAQIANNGASSRLDITINGVYRFLEIPAAVCQGTTAMSALTWATATAPTATCAGSNTTLGYLSFSASSTQTIQGQFWLPASATTVNLSKLVWNTPSTSGNVVWRVRTQVVGLGGTVDPSWSGITAQDIVSAAQSTTNLAQVASLTGVTVPAGAAGKLVVWQVERVPGDASDTVAGAANLYHIQFEVQ
jgi:hypothetical protein